ncbi:VCBS repeat-containing protein [Fulvivirgaceae bacterium PWU4]|uniref:VCBS repeat-containing protein n=1 Tax=Chryseosolibacter histidini TaxID=2782349 RepID=A0AAP2DP37_9BACT|nr:FG-GAP-like repeat-containing protein [Chryseosolibacter histidini]MBT1699903.1 VCBS repeat-containing protein [Chryseosolibacter histidini]
MQKTVKFLTVIALCATLNAAAQKPIVLSADKENGALREVVTLRGSDFGSDATKLKVFFGAATGEIKEVSNQILQVRVPAGATYDNISVTNTTTGLTGYSPLQFGLKFGGRHGLTAANFIEGPHVQAESGLYDLYLSDLNGDNKVDVATASDKSNQMAVFQNNSTTGTISLGGTSTLINAKSLHVACGDLNGDGKPDMAVSEGADGNRIYILRNQGTMNFTSLYFISLAGRKVKKVAIADLDLDGKPEVVVTDKGSNVVTILPNKSTAGGAITFGTPVTFTVTDVPSTDALELKDLNGDGLPEIVTSKFNTAVSNIYICQNKSTPGTFNFSDITTINMSGSVINLRVGDLDGDRKPDIAATRFLGSDVVILLNQSTTSQIAFGTPVPFGASQFPSGLDFGDLDGDGKTDIVTGSVDVKSLTILNNNSTPGALNFSTVTLATDFVSRHVKIGDIDGDAKPDIIYTSVDKDGQAVSQISVFRNATCFVPVVSPAGPLTICNGFALELTSTTGGGVTYSWQNAGAPVAGTDPSLDITASGTYTVTATSEGGACAETSAVVNITVTAPGAGLTPGDPEANSNTPVCTENTLSLTVKDLGASGYKWTGPNGFTSGARQPSISNFAIANAGLYVVELIKDGCVAKVDSTIVEGINNPKFTVTFSGSELLCQGSTKTLSVSPVLTSGFTYKWFEQTQGQIAGQTSGSYGATASGQYYASVASTHPGCAPVETPKVTITAVAIPDAAFTPSTVSGCIRQAITFTNQSIVDPQTTPVYTWTFGDNTATASDASPVHTYTQPATYQVKLKVTYQDGICPNEETKQVAIVSAPPVTITNPRNSFNLCAGDTLRLVASGDAFTAYAWSTGETTPFIIVNEAKTYSVSVTNSTGCILEASQALTPVAAPTVTATAQPSVITVGQFSMLSGTGLQNYLWRPGLSLNDSTIANPVATPLQDITYKVIGTDINGCKGEATVSIRVLGTSVLDQIKPKNYFSPNDDTVNPFWTVQDIESFPECGVTIYNDKGAKVFEAKPYNNNWDGTFKGSKLPGGVYYYVIRCDEESRVKTGSISLLK